jgi:hypothetical protein
MGDPGSARVAYRTWPIEFPFQSMPEPRHGSELSVKPIVALWDGPKRRGIRILERFRYLRAPRRA